MQSKLNDACNAEKQQKQARKSAELAASKATQESREATELVEELKGDKYLLNKQLKDIQKPGGEVHSLRREIKSVREEIESEKRLALREPISASQNGPKRISEPRQQRLDSRERRRWRKLRHRS